MLAGHGYMTTQQTAGVVSDTAQTEVIDTRFGPVTVQKSSPIVFPNGILGMPDKYHFCLTEFPSEKLRQQFKLLQSLDDYSLSFITLPVDLKNAILSEEDLQRACKEMELNVQDAAILLVVSVHRGQQSVQLSVNARAPILIDAPRRLAVQYVFQSDKYKVQHLITG